MHAISCLEDEEDEAPLSISELGVEPDSIVYDGRELVAGTPLYQTVANTKRLVTWDIFGQVVVRFADGKIILRGASRR